MGQKKVSGGWGRHTKLFHVKLFSVTPVTGLRGRVPRQEDLCSLGSKGSTQIFDPLTPDREAPPPLPDGHRPKMFMFTILFEIMTFLIRKPFLYVHPYPLN